MERVWREVEAAGPGRRPRRPFRLRAGARLARRRAVESFEGRVDGTLIWPPRGDKGFGYDPMFVPPATTRPSPRSTRREKHRISHRADAFAKLVAALALAAGE